MQNADPDSEGLKTAMKRGKKGSHYHKKVKKSMKAHWKPSNQQ
jgi:hypothetical protein